MYPGGVLPNSKILYEDFPTGYKGYDTRKEMAFECSVGMNIASKLPPELQEHILLFVMNRYRWLWMDKLAETNKEYQGKIYSREDDGYFTFIGKNGWVYDFQRPHRRRFISNILHHTSIVDPKDQIPIPPNY